MPSEIVSDVQRVLEDVCKKYPDTNPLITAYQILDRLPKKLQNKLIEERGYPGKDSGVFYASASLVSNAAEMIKDIEIKTLDISDMKLFCVNIEIKAGNPCVALYRIKTKE